MNELSKLNPAQLNQFNTTNIGQYDNVSRLLSPSNGPDASHPGFVVGKYILRPAIDTLYDLSVSTFKIIQHTGRALDNFLEGLTNIFPVASAKTTDFEKPQSTTIEEKCLTTPIELVNDQLPEEQKHFDIPLLGTLTNDELLEKFENLGFLGAGSHGVVFKVRCKQNGKLYALRLDGQSSENGRVYNTPPIRELMHNQNHNPHLAKIYSAFWLEQKNFRFWPEHASKKFIRPTEKLETGQFIRTDYAEDPEATTFLREVIIMEIGKGDLRGKDIDTSMCIQHAFNAYSLYNDRISDNDDKDRNYIWLPIEGQKIRGKLLENYKFWHYRFGEYDIYLPRQENIIKRIDFSGWKLGEWNPNSKDLGKYILESRCKSWDLKTIDDIAALYPRPKDIYPDEILDIN